MRPSRRLLTPPVAVVLLGFLTACSSPSPEAGPAATASASASTRETPDGRGLDLTAANFVQTISAALATVSSYDFTMTVSGEGAGESAQMSGSAHVLGDAPAFAMGIESPAGGRMEIRTIGGLAYVNLAELTGGKFLQMDPDDTSNPLAANLDAMMGDTGPSQGIVGHEAAVVSVTKTGAVEQVGGVDTQAYDVVIDLAQHPEKLAELEKWLVPGAEVPATFASTYWVDAEGLIRRVGFDHDGTRTDLTFSRFGDAAPVVVPPADQISTVDPFAG